MATPSPLGFFIFFCVFLPNLLSSTANLQKSNLFRSLNLSQHNNAPPEQDTPTIFFQVSRPISLPHTIPCSVLILQHDFGFTYSKPPVTAPYSPPTNCPSQNFSKIVLQWTATCKGRQFDRIFGVWMGGVELLRSCTAEPRANGIIWTVEKDITRYSSLLKNPQTLAVYLGNLVDETYTGVYHVNITIHFYPVEEIHPQFTANSANSHPGFDSPADLILPISRNLPLNDGLWFLVENSSDTQRKEFEIPGNVYRAVLEVFVSFHSSDEFWYTNPPNEYLIANNLTGFPGNGPFREVVVNLDDEVVGSVWPFTVIYTGGINPLLWRPITGIGSFDLPTYDIEITPFLEKIMDGKRHTIGFCVTNALDVWYIDANLHLWLDSRSMTTEGKLIEHRAPPISLSMVSNFTGINGSFLTKASRSISSTGWVNSSHGNVTTKSFQGFNFINIMVFGEDGNLQVVNQTIDANYSVYAEWSSSDLYSIQVFQRFPLHLYQENLDRGNGTINSIANISLGFNEDRFSGPKSGYSISYLRNKQNGQGDITIKGNLVTFGVGSTQQKYKYDSAEGCYFRDVSSRNYTILHDKSGENCTKKSKFGSGFKFGRKGLHLKAGRPFLPTDNNEEENGD